MVGKKQKKNYEIVMNGQMRDCFNEIFIDWTTTNKAKKILTSGRYATLHKYKLDFRKSGYIEIEPRTFTDKNGRTLQAVTQIRGTLKPYFDYLKENEIEIPERFIEILKIFFESKFLRAVIIEKGGNIINGMNYFLQLSMLVHSNMKIEISTLQGVCLYPVIEIQRNKSRYKEITKSFLDDVDNQDYIGKEEKFYLYAILLNNLFINPSIFDKNTQFKIKKIIPFIDDYFTCSATPYTSEGIQKLSNFMITKHPKKITDFIESFDSHPTIAVDTRSLSTRTISPQNHFTKQGKKKLK
jgi:hypothetical protein